MQLGLDLARRASASSSSASIALARSSVSRVEDHQLLLDADRVARPGEVRLHRRGSGTRRSMTHRQADDRGGPTMALGYDGKLYILAFDHRGLVPEEDVRDRGRSRPRRRPRRSADAKQLIYEGMDIAVERGRRAPTRPACSSTSSSAATSRAGQGARAASSSMPVEKSGQNEFDFQYGDDFGEHILEVRPRLLQGPRPLQPRRRRRDERAPARAAQAARRLAARERPQVPLRAARAGRGRPARVRRRRHRPLRRRAAPRADAPRDRGHPGLRHRGRHLEDRGRRRAVATPRCSSSRPARARAARASSACCSAAAPSRRRRSTTGCRRAAPVDGFIGFAIGRSIWWDALKGFLDGRSSARRPPSRSPTTTCASSRSTTTRKPARESRSCNVSP